MSSNTPSDTPKQYYDAEGKPVTLMRLVLTEPAWANNQILDRDRIERELAASRSDLECQGQAYSKALDDLAAANKRLEEVTNIVARFAAWSKKWPKDVIHPASKEREMYDELDAIEAAALAAIDGKEGK